MLRRLDRGALATLSRSFGQAAARGRLKAALACCALLLAPLQAVRGDQGGPRLAVPVRCTLGVDCFIQNYFDRDPGPGWRDYACGSLSYDGHKGTDFRVGSVAQMRHGYEVLAAADGVVVATRDGEPDLGLQGRTVEDLQGRDAGNGVRIDHGNGWETQYSHLRRGSVRVRRGQRVRAGDVLGLIGLSGRTEFPHLDFAVRHGGRALDPFAPDAEAVPRGDATGCPAGPTEDALWRDDAIEGLRYVSSGVLIAGIAGEKPDRGKAQRGEYAGPIESTAPALVFWIEVFGPRSGDIERYEVLGPGGELYARRERRVDRNYAARFSFEGRRRGEQPWPTGEYRARYALERDGRVVADKQVSAIVR